MRILRLRDEALSPPQPSVTKRGILNTPNRSRNMGLTLPYPPFFTPAFRSVLRHCDAFVTNFTAAEFRALYCTIRFRHYLKSLTEEKLPHSERHFEGHRLPWRSQSRSATWRPPSSGNF
ncbi:hypothetical protein EVAR_14028_1 [Eumeta japonica]|uniref:Uncharacterized protein n=1 Tax=Eumeta variegata TaxID=151549 RepID=A0A4C1X921_EUMVA|nr:hypothetical protein EVAR_14028_1 [Eumeta japonica]